MYSIIITQKELENFAKKHYDMPYISGYTDIAEDLGICVEVGGMYEEYWYMEAIWEAEDYAKKNYDFESDILALSDDDIDALAMEVKHDLPKGDGVHTKIASYALHNEEGFSKFVEEVKDLDNDTLYFHFKDFEKEIDDCRESVEKDMRRDFVSGDYHGNFRGIEWYIKDHLNAEEADVIDYESVRIDWNEEDLRDLMRDYFGKADMRLAKKYALKQLCAGAKNYKAKCKAENEKRRQEREAQEKRKEEREALEAKERKEKLDAIRY